MIVITGASFALHEYDDDSSISGPGIGQYLSLNNEVFVIAKAAASNTLALNKLQDFLEMMNNDFSSDTFYWLVTDPTRCIEDNLKALVGSDPSSLLKETLNNSLERANDLAKKFNITINLVGAECDLPCVEYSNLTVAVKSWGQLLENNWPVGLTYDIDSWKQKLPTSDKLVDILENINNKYSVMNQSKWFKALHPTSKAHLKLAFELNEDFKEYYLQNWPDTEVY